jgi:peptide deformylase
MALLKIASMGNPVLRRTADPVADPTDPMIRALVSDMIETMTDAGGVGLAAPQVHVPLRIVVLHVPAERADLEVDDGKGGNGEDEPRTGDGMDRGDDEAIPLTVLINPVIEPLGEDAALGWEGCLSVPGMRGLVPRYTHIRYSATGLDGRPLVREASDFHARVVQHECDHLDGILYPMRMTDLRLLGFVEELDRHPIQLVGEGDDEDEDEMQLAEAGVEDAP